MTARQITTLGLAFTLGACKPVVEEPIDEEAYDLCAALYDHARSCGEEIADIDDAAETCSKTPPWDGPCRQLQKEQFECYAALSCSDETDMTPAFQACEDKLHEKSVCTANHR